MAAFFDFLAALPLPALYTLRVLIAVPTLRARVMEWEMRFFDVGALRREGKGLGMCCSGKMGAEWHGFVVG